MKKSRQFTFINNQHGFTLSYINGNSLLEQIHQIHNIGPHAFEFYQKTLLSSLQMLNFLKPSENLGFYIDSDEPYYRFKIEMSSEGHYRTLLLPEDFEQFPTHLTGKCRVFKYLAGRAPYSSVLDFKDHPIENLVNEVIDKSYQTNSKVFTSPKKSNSVMLSKLPPSSIDKKIKNFEELSIKEIELKFAKMIQNALSLENYTLESIVSFFEKQDLTYLGSNEVAFHCPCGHERMLENLFRLPLSDRESLFETQDIIETRCDYCNTTYEFSKREVLRKDLH